MPDKVTSKEAICLHSGSNIFYQKQSSTAEESPQQSTSDSSTSEARNTEEISEKMASSMEEENAQQSRSESSSEKRDREIEGILKKIKEGKENTKSGIDMLRKFVTSLHKIVKDAEYEKEKRVAKKHVSVTFAIKSANKDRIIDSQIIDYIKKEIPKDILEMKITFAWENRAPGTPLVVFCNYSSRIGVDVQVSLRGVQEPKVILIILHYVRRALLKGDLSDDDYLLPDNLKDKTICIAHFAFDDELYDCKQNRCSRDKLCSDLKSHLNIVSNENTCKEVSFAAKYSLW